MNEKYGGQVTQMGVYLDGGTLIGIAEVKLPTVKQKQITLSGGGLMGEITLDSPSQIEAMETELKFNNVGRSIVNLWSSKGGLLELKAYISGVGANHVVDDDGNRITIKGKASELDLGTLKPSELVSPTVKYNTTFFEWRQNGQSILKIDKINGIFEQFGVPLIKNLLSIT